MLTFDPCQLFAHAECLTAGICVHVRTVIQELGVVSGHLSILRPKSRTRNLDGLPIVIFHTVDVARVFDDVAPVEADSEVMEEVGFDYIIVIDTVVPYFDIIAPVWAGNPGTGPICPIPGL